MPREKEPSLHPNAPNANLPGTLRPGACGDVRLRGFSDRVPFTEAVAWLDAHAHGGLPAEEIGVAAALGRVLAEPISALADIPAIDSAAVDGYALRSVETEGASDYNPLQLALAAPRNDPDHPLPLAGAAMVSAGAPLPCGADAVMPFDATQLKDTVLEIFTTVAAGSGVERRGRHARSGGLLIEAGRVLRAQDVGLLSSVGIARVRVLRFPRVRLIIAGPKKFGDASAAGDAVGPMLRALLARDGGQAEEMQSAQPHGAALAQAIAVPGADVIVVAGRTGTGEDDEAALALAKVGELAIHGIALRPGGSAGMGLSGTAPVLLLPGDPLACLCAYELLAGRLIRRLAGRNRELPHRARVAEVGRKIVSAVGFVDVWQVRIVEGRIEPIASVEFGGLTSSVRADGFVVVPASLEGYAPGTQLKVFLY